MNSNQSLIRRSTLRPVDRLELVKTLIAETGPAGVTLNLGPVLFDISGEDWRFILNAAQERLELYSSPPRERKS